MCHFRFCYSTFLKSLAVSPLAGVPALAWLSAGGALAQAPADWSAEPGEEIFVRMATTGLDTASPVNARKDRTLARSDIEGPAGSDF